MRSFVSQNPFLVFASLTLGIQFGIIGVVKFLLAEGMHIHEHPTAHMIFRFRLFVPLAMAMLVTFYLEGGAGLKKLFSSFLHWRVPAKWYALAFSWKFTVAWLGIMVTCLFSDAVWPGFFAEGFFWNWLISVPAIVLIAFVEETSWIRFSMTRMQMRYNAFWSAMIVGNCWGGWYLPMILIGEGVPPAYPVPIFHGCMLSLTILLIWVYNSTRSGTVLLVMQIISNTVFFMVPVLPGGIVSADGVVETRYVIGFSWIFITVAVVLVAVFGMKNLSRKQRVRWDDPEETTEVIPNEDVVLDPVPVPRLS